MSRDSLPPDTLAGRILAHSALRPESVAVHDDGRDVTYRSLAVRSARLAEEVRRIARGGRPPVVAVALPRGADLLATVLAVLRLGAVYLPVNPEQPLSRLKSIVDDARPDIVVAVGATHPAFDGVPAVDPRDVDEKGGPDGEFEADPAGFRYLLYTSGSTGTPKGVISGHAGLWNRLVWMEEEFGLGPADRVLHKTPLTFDVSLWELISPLLAGSTVVLARPGGHLDGRYLHDLISAQQVTVLHFVPSMLASFARANEQTGTPGATRSVRIVTTSGEALGATSAATALQLFPNARLYNLYGPTEASIDVTSHLVRDTDLAGATVPIGRPITGIRTHVVGPDGRPVPTGDPGELWLAGVGLAYGYVNRPEETAAAFVTAPPHLPEERVYRTGDLVRENDRGELEYLGRNDRQVKFRGVRIELAEVEYALDRYPGVTTSRVVVRGAADRLVAVVQTSDLPDESTDQPLFRWPELAAELHHHLAALLPASMLPTHFLFTERWPVTEHGKLDLGALSQWIDEQETSVPVDGAGHDRAASDGALADRVLAIFRTVLGIEDIGENDSFFDVGGDSLAAATAAYRVEESILAEFSLDISGDASIFVHPTAKELAHDIEARLPGRP
ncbi:non-ribosomal peptide synthetase [Streptomyces avermitilis]|uniref:non-ribosomal peptide synthetase n=1 Tax=Streptomyces avermitilis TaxID=33903 RepID=UPI0036A74FA1